MTNAEELFEAIGGADESLLARCEKPIRSQRRWLLPLGATACLALVLAGVFWTTRAPATSPVTPVTPPDTAQSDTAASAQVTLRLDGGDVGELHLCQISYGPNREMTVPDFIIYVNQESYQLSAQDGVYTVTPLVYSDTLPPCDLTIVHLENISLQAAAEQAATELESTYRTVSEIEDSAFLEGGLALTASDGLAWDSEQADAHLVSDGQGGVFVLTARYFLEATEGHGARFWDMIRTFEVVSANDVAPVWMTELQDAAMRLIPAVASNDLADVADLLTDGAAVDGYGEDVSGDFSVRDIDYTVDDDQEPIHAVISVTCRISPEKPYDCLTMELTYQDGQWLAVCSGLEK